MEKVRPCGCKGIRSCLICEREFGIIKPNFASKLKKLSNYVYCPLCNKAWPGWNQEDFKIHPNHSGTPIDFPGIYIQLDFLSEREADILIKDLDSQPWEISQSGRKKQNYGPKCNFRKKRLRPGLFSGFPQNTRFIQEKFAQIPLMKDFQTVEQCTLEYDAQRGASIDPHIDDCWIWGERVVTVNVLSDSVLSMTPYRETNSRYNLNYLSTQKLLFGNEDSVKTPNHGDDIVVRIPMPERSLLIIYGAARYAWEHAVLREDIKIRRICLAYRELTTPFLPGGSHHEESIEILEKARIFW